MLINQLKLNLTHINLCFLVVFIVNWSQKISIHSIPATTPTEARQPKEKREERPDSEHKVTLRETHQLFLARTLWRIWA